MTSYPEIIPGGSLLIAWQLKDKRVILVGGGQVAAGRLVNLLQADALVTLIAPSRNLNNEVRYRIQTDPLAKSRITWFDRLYEGPQDLDGADMVLTAIDDNEASLRIWEDAKRLKIPVNVADVPPNCDFYFGSPIRRGDLQIVVSTNGKGPKLAALIRQRLEDALPPDVDVAIQKVGRLRELLRERAPGVGGKVGRDRMRWMSSICETWELEELAQLDEHSMQHLLDEGWEKNGRVLKYDDVSSAPYWKRALRDECNIAWLAGGILVGGLLAFIRLRRRLCRYDLALKDFEDALLYLRGNQAINYEQLGLQFRLYSAEVLFNRGLCQIYLSNERDGMQDLQDAKKEKVTEEHNVIDEAIRDMGEGYTVFSIPVGILYRPPENKMKNAKPKDYLGKAKLVAAENPNEAYTTFTGVTRMQQGYTPSGAPIDDQNLRGGADLKAAPSFSRARNPDNPSKTVERTPSTSARLERQNTSSASASSRDRDRGNGGAAGGGGGAGSANLQKSRSIAGRAGPGPGGPGAGMARSASAAGGGPGGARGDRNQGGDSVAGATGAMRGLSLRKQEGGGPAGDKRSPPGGGPGGRGGPAAGPGGANSRLTDIYADYLDDYGEEEAAPEDAKRVQAWAAKTKPGSPVGPSRATSQRMGPARSQYGGSSVSKQPAGRQAPGGRSNYGDEDEYNSGEEGFELLRIKVKIHFNGEVRGMALTPDVPFEEFVDRVHSKFSKNFGEMVMRFIDEDGMKVSLRDESDYDLAIETARDSAKGKPDGKLVIWVE
ncbi:hypothetical protein FRC17_006220 [Serendipita sp. 399]|nr:hypothetical protein FRC17_006220 [Serendipita sp. 399]